MTLGGLWHGANWTFVAWGVLHGLLLIVHKMFQGFCVTRPRLQRLLQSLPGILLRLGITLVSVCVGWVFFRAPTFAIAAALLRRMASLRVDLTGEPMPNIGLLVTIGVVVACHLIRHFDWWPRWQARMPASMLGFSYAAAVTLALFLAPSGTMPFIYFQF